MIGGRKALDMEAANSTSGKHDGLRSDNKFHSCIQINKDSTSTIYFIIQNQFDGWGEFNNFDPFGIDLTPHDPHDLHTCIV